MITTEREKLLSYTRERLSIGITPTGVPARGIAVPWESTGNAFNMRTPDIYLCEDDLYDEEILAELKKHTIIGFYALCGLKSYSLLAQFTDLEDLYLLDAQAMTDLSFMAGMSEWFMLFIHGANLPDLAPLFAAQPVGAFRGGYCLGLHSCQVADNSALFHNNRHPRELLIWNTYSKQEHARFAKTGAHVYRFYDTSEKE